MSEFSGLWAAEPACKHSRFRARLRPPDWNCLVRKQEGEISQLAATIEPPAALETQQQLDDISEADIRSSPDRLALGRRKCDLLQERKRHRENDRAASKAAAISTTNHHLARFRLDRAHHRSESKRDSTLAAVRRQEIDQGTITTDDSRL